MANTSRPMGFVPVKYASGKPYTGEANLYEIAAGDTSATMVGDIVMLSDQDATDSYAAVERIAASGVITAGYAVGVVVGFVVSPTDLNTPQYRAASTKRFALVADAVDLIMEVEEDSTGGSIALASIGLNSGANCAVGSTVTGASGMLLDSSSVAATATLPLRLVGLSRRADNAQGTSAKWYVAWNLHQFAVTAVATGALGI